MKSLITITVGLGLTATGCSEDADIGVAIDPVTCLPAAAGSVDGHVSYQGYEHDFGAVAVTTAMNPDNGATLLQVADTELFLRLGFYCGPAQLARYGVIPDNQSREMVCPFEVAGSLVGQVEYLPAQRGTVIVDENASCFAGRFHVELGNEAGDAGELVGWFSTPWQ